MIADEFSDCKMSLEEIEKLLVKFFDPKSDRYVFQQNQCEIKQREAGQKDVVFNQTVAFKKITYLNQFFDNEDKLKLMVEDKNFKFLNQLMENMVDMSVCQHLERAHRAKFMCHSCYHGRGNPYKAWLCEHKSRPNHSNGKCKACYHKQYYKHKLKQQKMG